MLIYDCLGGVLRTYNSLPERQLRLKFLTIYNFFNQSQNSRLAELTYVQLNLHDTDLIFTILEPSWIMDPSHIHLAVPVFDWLK